jgi:hypothetical protein
VSPEPSERAGEGPIGGSPSREKKEGCELDRECNGADVKVFRGVGGKPGLLLLTVLVPFVPFIDSGGKALEKLWEW